MPFYRNNQVAMCVREREKCPGSDTVVNPDDNNAMLLCWGSPHKFPDLPLGY